jgi:tRNA 2-thiocytidine biosynthesis protein TtcA
VQDTYSVVKRVIPEGKTMCGLCSRLRRGVLYRVAGELGATKIALGHHRDDIMETFFLNLFHGGKLKAMPPKLLSDDGKHTVIRPLAYVEEVRPRGLRRARAFPIIPCDLCGSQDQLQRKQVKAMLHEWERHIPGASPRSSTRSRTSRPRTCSTGSSRLREPRRRTRSPITFPIRVTK